MQVIIAGGYCDAGNTMLYSKLTEHTNSKGGSSMKKVFLCILVIFFIAGCATPKGVTRLEKRNYVLLYKV